MSNQLQYPLALDRQGRSNDKANTIFCQSLRLVSQSCQKLPPCENPLQHLRPSAFSLSATPRLPDGLRQTIERDHPDIFFFSAAGLNYYVS